MATLNNVIFLVDGDLVQLDDMLAMDNTDRTALYVRVSGKCILVSPAEPIAYLSRYVLTLTSGNASYRFDMETSWEFPLDSLYGKVPDGLYSMTVHADSKFGKAGREYGDISRYVLPPCAPMTLRFQFGKSGYDPNSIREHGWTKGVWAHVVDDVWDWTCTDPDWSSAFGSTSSTRVGAFMDFETNPVKVIDSGDTSGVTDISRGFAWCTGLTAVYSLDTRNATAVNLLFSQCHNLSEVCDLDFSSATKMDAVFQQARSLVDAPMIKLPTDHAYTMQAFFTNAASLKYVPAYDTSLCTNMYCMFGSADGDSWMEIEEIPYLDTRNVENAKLMFRHCHRIRRLPELDFSKVKTMENMCSSCSALESVKLEDLSSAVDLSYTFNNCESLRSVILGNMTSCKTMFHTFDNCTALEHVELGRTSSLENMHCTFQHCASLRHPPAMDTSSVTDFNRCFLYTSLEELPDWDFGKCTDATYAFAFAEPLQSISGLRLPAATVVTGIVMKCPNVQTGIYELYEHLSTKEIAVTEHSDAFRECGTNTEGAADLERIPVSWGGKMG